ncbi:response regulator, partial [Telmatospirillum sp.]|uniref:response regulator n=1 Tax=Telmatospirillum sp. TaxID=2079197 RepID=UPI0028452183
DGSQAITQLCQTNYDLVISDVRMPTLDGFGLLEWIKKHQPALVSRFIFITGDAGSVELNDQLESSEPTVLRKPFDVETLLQVCRLKMQTPFCQAAPEEVSTEVSTD